VTALDRLGRIERLAERRQDGAGREVARDALPVDDERPALPQLAGGAGDARDRVHAVDQRLR
jgi:hypothetical protein